MNDEALEAALRRYRVADAPVELGETVMTATEARARPFSHVWGAAAAAAVLALWFAAHAATREPEADPAREAEVAFVAESLGGGEDALRYAQLVVPERAPDVRLAQPVEVPW